MKKKVDEPCFALACTCQLSIKNHSISFSSSVRADDENDNEMKET